MNKKMWLLPFVAGIAAMSSIALAQDQTQQQDQTRQQDKVRQQIYGSQLMTPEERTAYRARAQRENAGRAGKNPCRAPRANEGARQGARGDPAG